MSILNTDCGGTPQPVGIQPDEYGEMIRTLANIICRVAQNVCAGPGPGLPACIHTMSLVRQSGGMGLKLGCANAMLHAHGHAARELIITDERLVIECIMEQELSPEMAELYRSRLLYDIGLGNYDMGLVINFRSCRNTWHRMVH